MKYAPVLFAAVLFSACQAPPPEFSEGDQAQVETEVMAWADQFLAALRAVDPDAAAGLLDTTEGHFVDGGAYFPDWDQNLANTKALFSTWESNEGDWTRTRVDVMGPEAALFVGDRSGAVVRTDGSEWEVRNLFTFVLKKGETGWKALHGHISGSWMPRRSD